ncbi:MULTISPECIES: hypothetical protein [Campylobacter]|uniref:hypothetical protein n=1 Tax=Campylobacter TaxID=194 RepID=UPI0008735911|nr:MULTISPECIES: hypothetical protein [Campylobacter]MCV3399082.1 hypothetical protein [Campylobacter lari]MCV3414604.1 hypothetical protein [Campylobacter lari]MCV3481695.1 hypothetical protein [Campylobacter lari]MCV3531284.1 hypothetical protein [Campylobacter sp. CNRCH_2007_0968H]MCW0224558.1 hypothetical protein [Campylobacter lari]
MQKIIWTCINCQKVNNTSLGSLKSLEKTKQILTSFNEEIILFAKCKKCKKNNELLMQFKIIGLSQFQDENKSKRTLNMVKINKERAKNKKEQIFSLLNGLFSDNYKDEAENYDIEKIALHANVNIKTAKKYILEYEKTLIKE